MQMTQNEANLLQARMKAAFEHHVQSNKKPWEFISVQVYRDPGHGGHARVEVNFCQVEEGKEPE